MNPSLVVLKFGSSVLPNRDSLPLVVHDVYRYYRRGHHVLAVVSAIGNETDRLLEEARCWGIPPSPDPAVAELLATGERQSAALLTIALCRAGIDCTLVSPDAIGLTLCGPRLDAFPVSVSVNALRRAFQTAPVLVLPGFAGVHEGGGTALMGRGGTDLTAVFLARQLAAKQCRLVKDVDGIYERDPARDVTGNSSARPHRYGGVTYEDALRVSGKLVQPKAIEYLRDQGTVARVAGLLLEDGTDVGAPSTRIHDRSAMRPLKVLLLGLGHVGQGVYRHLQQLGGFFEIAGILVRDRHKSRDFDVPRALLTTDMDDLMSRPHDLAVDVSSDPFTAHAVIKACVSTGRPAVTASKRLVAHHGPELTRLAAGSGTRFCYSATVGGSAPMLETLTKLLQDGAVNRLRGVLNGTCNYVLDRMAEGVHMHTAVSEARLRGFAESNVSRDLNGDESADKLRILARLAFGSASESLPISRHAITSPAGTFRLAASEGKVVRQVATFDPARGASVEQQALPADDYLAGAQAEENRLVITGADGREWRVSGKGAGRWPTAEAVLADLLDIHASLAAEAGSRREPRPVPARSVRTPATT